MLIGIENNSIGYKAQIIEVPINREGSKYIIDNYENLKNVIRKYDIKEEKANDLLHDVYLSVYEAEDNGEGFDMEYGSTVDSNGNINVDIMDVEQFIIGRIKLYAKNSKYRTDVIECYSGYVTETNTYYETEIDKKGKEILDKNGKPKVKKVVEKKKVPVLMSTNAASFNDGGDILDNNDDFQIAFAMAATADSTDDVTELESLREQIEYCIGICSMNGINIVNIFKNIDSLATMLGEHSKRKKTSDGVFKQISELVNYHTELGSNLIDILTYSSKNREAFELIIGQY